MGYRHYLYEIDKPFAEKIRKCKSVDDFISLVKREKPEIVEYDDGNDYVPLYNLGRKIFEFGIYYENADEMYKHGDILFYASALNEWYEDYGAILIDEEGLKCAIDWNRNHVIGMYEDLLREKSIDEWNQRSQLDRLISNAESYLYWWKANPADMDKSHDRIVDSWLYEHEFFELVRIYKTFDWESKAMMFIGW